MATYDSTVRLRQLNQPELSGYILEVIGDIPNTGNLTGIFYPLNSNPSSYITTGQTGIFVTQIDLDSNYYNILTQVGNNYYSLSNPYGYINSGQTGVFVVTGKTGNFVTTGQTGNFLTQATGIGIGSGVFSGKIGDQLIFRNILGGSGLNISSDSSGLILSVTGVDKLANFQNIVHTTGNQIISGIKSFSGQVNVSILNSPNLLNISDGSISFIDPITNIPPLQYDNGTKFTLKGNDGAVIQLYNDNLISGFSDVSSVNFYQTNYRVIDESQTGIFATSQLLSQTGYVLENKISSLSGTLISNYVAKNQTGIFITGGSNKGVGSGLYSGVIGNNLTFKSLKGGSGIKISGNVEDDTLTLILTGFVGAEVVSAVNNATNLTPGTGVFKKLNESAILEFKSLTGLNGIQITGNDNTLSIFSTGLVLNNQTGAFATTGNLFLTGNNLQTQVNSINSWTGNSINLYYPKTSNPSNYLNSAVTNLIVTGRNLLGNITLTGKGSISITTGNSSTIIISGAAGGGGGGGGDINNALNVGGYSGIFYQKNIDTLEFKTLRPGSGIRIIDNINYLTLEVTGISGGGTINNINQTGSNLFRTQIQSGVDKQFINFPISLDTGAIVITTLNNSYDSTLITVQASGIQTGGFWAIFSNKTTHTGYYLDTLASLSTNTGLAVTAFIITGVNNGTNLGDGSGLFVDKLSNNLRFKTIKGINGIRITGDSQNLVFETTGVSINSGNIVLLNDATHNSGIFSLYNNDNNSYPIIYDSNQVIFVLNANNENFGGVIDFYGGYESTGNPLISGFDIIANTLKITGEDIYSNVALLGNTQQNRQFNLYRQNQDEFALAFASGNFTLIGISGKFIDLDGKYKNTGPLISGLIIDAPSLKINGKEIPTGGKNLGIGSGIYATTTDTLNFKTLIGDSGIRISGSFSSNTLHFSITGINYYPSDSNPSGYITSGQTGNFITGAKNTGQGSGIFSGKLENQLILKSLIGGSGIRISGNSQSLTFEVTGIVGGSTITQIENVIYTTGNQSISGEKVFLDKIGIGTGSPRGVFDVDAKRIFTLPNITSDFSLSFVYGDGFYPADGNYFSFYVYGYKYIEGQRIYSLPTHFDNSDNGLGNFFYINLSWDTNSAYDGYYVLVDEDVPFGITNGYASPSYGILLENNTYNSFEIGKYNSQGYVTQTSSIYQDVNNIGIPNVFSKTLGGELYLTTGLNYKLIINNNLVEVNKDLLLSGFIINGEGNPTGSIIIGSGAAKNALNQVFESNIIGKKAGYHTNYSSSNINYSNLIGSSAGINSEGINFANVIGYEAEIESIDFQYSNSIGFQAGRYSKNTLNSNFIGSAAGGLSSGTQYSNAIGYLADYNSINSQFNNFLGFQAGDSSKNTNRSNFIGYQAGYQSSGLNTGIFIGYRAGASNNLGASNSILIGNYTSTNGFSNSIAIGQGVANSTGRQLNVGNILYATNVDTGIIPSSNPVSGRVGILIPNPQYTLDVSGDCRISGNLIIGGSGIGFNSFVTTGQTGRFVTTGDTGNFITKITGFNSGFSLFSGTFNNAIILRSISGVSGVNISFNNNSGALLLSVTGLATGASSLGSGFSLFSGVTQNNSIAFNSISGNTGINISLNSGVLNFNTTGLVYTNGNQTISGIKTFATGVVLSGILSGKNIISENKGYGAGIYTFSKTLTPTFMDNGNPKANFFAILSDNWVGGESYNFRTPQYFDVIINSPIGVVKKYSVYHVNGLSPMSGLLMNSGPTNSTYDFSVSFFETGIPQSGTGVAMSVDVDGYGTPQFGFDFTATVFLGGSPTKVKVIEL